MEVEKSALGTLHNGTGARDGAEQEQGKAICLRCRYVHVLPQPMKFRLEFSSRSAHRSSGFTTRQVKVSVHLCYTIAR